MSATSSFVHRHQQNNTACSGIYIVDISQAESDLAPKTEEKALVR